MDRIIYTSMTGANAAAHRQAVLSNNLANVSTNGFRAEMSTFRSVPLQGEGASTRVFALEATSGHRDTPGPVQRTGRNLAMAVSKSPRRDSCSPPQAWRCSRMAVRPSIFRPVRRFRSAPTARSPPSPRASLPPPSRA